jgi:hypothetical protein
VSDYLEEQNKRDQERILNDWCKVLSHPEGRRTVWRLISECGVYQSSMTGNAHTFFNEGKRVIGLMVLREIELAKPGITLQMQREFTSDQKVKAEKLRKQQAEEERN